MPNCWRPSVNDLEKRKKLLLAEAEVYRQTLKLELNNLRIYGLKTRRKLTSFSVGNPVLVFGIPILTSWLARRRKLRQAGALGFIGWQLLKRCLSLIPDRLPQRWRSRRTGAEEYLARRM